MPRFSFITTIDAPDENFAHAIYLAMQGGSATYNPPEKNSRHFGPVVKGDIQADIDDLHEALCELEFDDPDAPVSGSDTVDVICQFFPKIAAIASPIEPDSQADGVDPAEDDASFPAVR